MDFDACWAKIDEKNAIFYDQRSRIRGATSQSIIMAPEVMAGNGMILLYYLPCY
jgi:hypothetical protein